MNNITDYDLLDLIGASDWPDEKKRSTLNRYVIALIGYLNEKINNDGMGLLVEDKFSRLVKQPDITEKKLNDFFKEQSSVMLSKFNDWTGEFKRMFVLSVYQAKLIEVKKKNLLGDETEENSKNWEKILSLASQSEWDQVIAQIKALVAAPKTDGKSVRKPKLPTGDQG